MSSCVTQRLQRVAPPIVTGLLLVTAWQVVVRIYSTVPSLGGTLSALWDGITAGWMLTGARETLYSFGWGYATALVLGALIGVALGSSPYWRSVANPLISVIYAVPKITLFPIFLVIFGVGPRAAIALALISSFFPVLYYTLEGVHLVPRVYLNVARIAGSNRRQMLTKVYLPAIIPGFLVGARIAFAVALVSVMAAELKAGQRGLGAALYTAYVLGDLDRMMSIGVFIFVLGGIGSGVLSIAARWFGWRRRQHSEMVGSV